jgi:hypothetical protein
MLFLKYSLFKTSCYFRMKNNKIFILISMCQSVKTGFLCWTYKSLCKYLYPLTLLTTDFLSYLYTYMNLGVYILWLFVLPNCTYGSWIKVYIYIVTSCPTYTHVKQKYMLWPIVGQGKKYRLCLFVLWFFVLGVLWLFVLWLSVRLPMYHTKTFKFAGRWFTRLLMRIYKHNLRRPAFSRIYTLRS